MRLVVNVQRHQVRLIVADPEVEIADGGPDLQRLPRLTLPRRLTVHREAVPTLINPIQTASNLRHLLPFRVSLRQMFRLPRRRQSADR